MVGEKILCIDDSIDICDLLQLHLSEEGYVVDAAHNATQALEKLPAFLPDLVLLDVLLPDSDGLSLLRIIHENYKNTPVIMISGRGEDIDKIIGIEAGADDYLTKPFNMRELLARIRMVLRRFKINSDSNDETNKIADDKNKVTFDHWTLDRKQYQVFDESGQSANLTTNEFLLLDKLASNPFQAFSREQLFDVWRDQGINLYDRAVDVQVTRIRSKLNDDPKQPKYIKTVHGIGYMFTGKPNS